MDLNYSSITIVIKKFKRSLVLFIAMCSVEPLEFRPDNLRWHNLNEKRKNRKKSLRQQTYKLRAWFSRFLHVEINDLWQSYWILQRHDLHSFYPWLECVSLDLNCQYQLGNVSTIYTHVHAYNAHTLTFQANAKLCRYATKLI